MADRVTLSAAVRSNLLSLQNATRLIDTTQNRLSSGLAVAKATDDAVKFFQAKSLNDRATDLTDRKDSIDQGVSALESVLEATSAIEDLVSQAKGIFQSLASQSKAQRKSSQDQLVELVRQVQNLVNDSTYQGLNLLNSTSATLTVRFSEKSDSKLDTNGVNFNASVFFKTTAGADISICKTTAIACILSQLGGFVQTATAAGLSDAANLASFNKFVDKAVKNLESTINNIRSKSADIATNAAILRVRLDFTTEYVNVLETGAGKLTLADLNEEGANLVALQTRQQLGINALSFAGQAEQSILTLFR